MRRDKKTAKRRRGGGGEGLINNVYMGRLRPDFQPLTLSYTTFGIKGTIFVYILLKNGAPFTYLLAVR